MNQYRCETCKNRKTIYGEYACEVVSRKMTKCFYEWVTKVGCASHSDFQSGRDCPVCGGGLMCHRWCIDRDCGWDSIPVGRRTMTPPQCPDFILAETTDGLILSYRGEEFTVDDDMRKDLIAYLEIQSRRDKVLDRLDKEIHIREDEMNRRAGLEENLVIMSGYYASAGALNWVRKVLIDGSRETIRQAGSP